MLENKGIRGLLIGVLGLASLSSAQAQDVELNPGTITGAARVGTETIRRLFVSANSNPFSAQQSLFPNAPTATYDLTVQVEAMSSRTYQVSAFISTDNFRDTLSFGSAQDVTVTDGTPATLDFIVDSPGFIDGTVTLTGGGIISNASIFASQSTAPFASSSTSPLVNAGSTTFDYSFPVLPGQEMRCGGTLFLTNGIRISLPQQLVTPPAGGAARCDFTVATPPTGSIAGAIEFSGPQTVNRYDVAVSGPEFRSATVSPPFTGPGNRTDYRVDNLQTGSYSFSTTRAFLNNFDDEFRFPNSAFSPSRGGHGVSVGGETTVDAMACQAFLSGTVEFTGTATVGDLSFGTATAQGVSSGGSSSAGGSSVDRMTAGSGAFDVIVGEGEWFLSQFRADLRRPLTSPDGFLFERIFLNDFVSQNNPIVFTCGDSAARDVTFPTGGITINFTVAGGGTLSNPQLNGSCQARDETTNALIYSYSFQSFSSGSGQIDVPLGQVTFEGPAAICSTITARATVAGSTTTFATINNLEIVPGTDVVIDPGAPTVMVTFPEPNLIIDADMITVQGTATDTVDIASLTVNGMVPTIVSTGNPNDPVEVEFEATVPLPAKGPNDIVVIATDSAGNTSTTTLNVFNDAAPPAVDFTPADGATVSPVGLTIAGTASDDAGIASVVITVDGELSATVNGSGATVVEFDEPFDLSVNDHTVTVVVTDISERSTTVVRSFTVATNSAPVAQTLNVQTDEDTAVAVTLLATDADGDTLTFDVLTQPQNGSLSGDAPNLTYTPSPNSFGPDSFTYRANDGTVDSNVATVAITVQSVNDQPVANAGPDQTLECAAQDETLAMLDGSASSDADGDSLVFNWSNSFGTATGSTPTVGLTIGVHAISLVVNDGMLDSDPDTVNVSIVDSTPPTLSASLVLIGNGDDGDDDDEGLFRIEFTASDVCDAAPVLTAVLNVQGLAQPIAVDNGQIVEFEFDDEEAEVEWETDDGQSVLEIEAPGLELAVTATDASGNETVVTAVPTGLAADNDDDSLAMIDD